MDTRNKLEETQYFLDELIKTKNDTKLFHFNLSAFLSVWRSVLDIMLYDFAEYYSIGFTRQDIITHQTFKAVASALKHNNALKFIDWWREKQGELMQNPLWAKRRLIIHRGYPTITATFTFYVSGSGGTSITVTQLQSESIPAGSSGAGGISPLTVRQPSSEGDLFLGFSKYRSN